MRYNRLMDFNHGEALFNPIEIGDTVYEPTASSVGRTNTKVTYAGGNLSANIIATGRTVTLDTSMHNYQRGMEGPSHEALTIDLNVEYASGNTRYAILEQRSVHEGMTYPPANLEALQELRSMIHSLATTALTIVDTGEVRL